ncbi:ATP-binding protein [Qipengyuania vesicularis]|uniref:ATP-binding protein n=1 Tax=Qipengyuania vesicularis TaxID=2867232 RepID=UPI001C877D5C|nr:ATP-binding protein [Qipengyuania vesicularis]MBX7527796.1 MASE1 domain-containing protein [Qipengyuania vesicularis]
MATLSPILDDGSVPGMRPLHAAALALSVFLTFGLLAYVSIELTRNSGRIASIWLPNALAVAFLLRTSLGSDRLVLAACLLGNLAANLFVGDPVHFALTLAVANSVEVMLAVFLVRQWCGARPDMANIADLTRFMLAACAIAPIASTAIASLAFFESAGGGIGGMIRWAMSDALSMLVIAPSALVFWDAFTNRRRPNRSEMIDWILLTTFGTTLTYVIFNQSTYPLLFLIPPVVVAHAFRLGSLGTAFSVLKVALIALVFTELGRGPISILSLEPGMKMLLLEAFLASATIVGMPVAAILSTRERMAHEVAQGRRQLALLANNITDAILRYDLDGRCTYASPSVARVLGEAPSTFVGSTTAERSHPESRDAIAGVLHRLATGKSDTERFTYRRLLDDDEGKAVYLEADCAIARNGETGKREGIIVSARDVTVRVELERQLKRATRHAENAARAKAQFLANMSHEIRTPMNGVLGFADLLRQMELDQTASRYADMIVRSGRSMMMLLNDILDISKIESGQLVLSLEDFDLREMAEDCVSLHFASAESKGVRLSLRCDPDLPRRAVSDPLRLRQIILNLIANAVKFTEQGQVEVAVGRENDCLTIAVEDSGIGIDPSRLERIFDPFIQEESSTTRRFGGTGLGLSISRQLADLLGGSLTVDSMPGVGSRFTLRVPLEVADTHPARKQEARGKDPIPELRSRARVLLAEDHDVNRMLVVAMLEQLGQTVTVAKDGLEAVSAVIDAHGSENAFDLVLMDVQMPGCDGYSATRMIRRSGIGEKELPIVALTANAYPEDIDAAHEAGMQAHLAKPLVFSELAEALARWLPVKIVEEGVLEAKGTAPAVPVQSSEMRERWNLRRSEAIEAVSEAVRNDAFEGVRIEQLARTVHKLAGTAGMFGEEELGRKAAALERALRAGVEGEVRRKLAEELLAAA